MTLLGVSAGLLLISIFRPSFSRITVSGYALMAAGTLSNLIDRTWRGGVVDMLSLGNFSFNFSDCMIVVGVVLVLWDERR